MRTAISPCWRPGSWPGASAPHGSMSRSSWPAITASSMWKAAMRPAPGSASRSLRHPSSRALKAFLDREGLPLDHIKPHGSLYGLAMWDSEMAEEIANAMQWAWPGLHPRILHRPRLHRRRRADHHARARGLRSGRIRAARRTGRQGQDRDDDQRMGPADGGGMLLRAFGHAQCRTPGQNRARSVATFRVVSSKRNRATVAARPLARTAHTDGATARPPPR